MSHRHCFALDLVDETSSIRAYEEWHQPGKTPSEVIAFFRSQGVEDLQIYRTGNRLFMILDLEDKVGMSEFAGAGAANSDMQAWADRMSAFQQSIAAAHSSSPSWVAMSKLFNLKEHPETCPR